jgi:hypothetical protein
MYNPYGFHSMSNQYREEALRDARRRYLEARLPANRRVDRGRSRAGLAWGGLLAFVLHGARLAGQTPGWSEEQR